MNCDILFCSLNSKYAHSSLAPWYLYASVKNNLPEVTAFVYENTINADSERVISDILNYNAKVYSFSCYIWNIDFVLNLCKEIKNKKQACSILLGGPEVSYNSKELFEEHEFIDYIISGEGEEPIVEFLKHKILGCDRVKDIGLCSRDNISSPYISESNPPDPYCDEYFENLNGRITYIESTRGCPYSCAFCLSGRCGGVRFFPLEETFAKIIKLANSGTKTIKFVDRTFNADYKRSNEIFEYIIENSGKLFPENVCFHFEIAGDIIRNETLDILEKAPLGLFQFEIGLQTFNEKTLAYINRKTNIDILVLNIKRLLELNNIHIHIDLIAGLPYEDFSSFGKTFNIAYSLKADMLQLGFLKLLHGAPMREDDEKYPCEFSKSAPYQVISTPWLSESELNIIECAEDALERLYNSGRFNATLDYIFETTHVKPFEFFCKFGKSVSSFSGVSLDEYTKMFFDWITKNYKVDQEVLKDVFVVDRLCSNASGKMPEFLKRISNDYGKIKKHLKQHSRNVGFALLSDNTVAFQKKSAPIQKNGRYQIETYKKDEVLKFISENNGENF